MHILQRSKIASALMYYSAFILLQYSRYFLASFHMPPTLVRAPSIPMGRHTFCAECTPPRISIQWALIVKYVSINLECHRLHVKMSFTSFQLLSLLNFLIDSICRLDISENMQCASQQNFNTSLRYPNTNHISIIIKTMADKKNKTMQWKQEIRTGRNQEASLAKRIQYLYGDTLFPKVLGHLGSKLLV